MKRFKYAFRISLLIVFTVVLGGCKRETGTYYLYSISVTENDETVEYLEGDKYYKLKEPLNREMVTATLKNNGDFRLKSTVLKNGNFTAEWKPFEGESDKITVTIEEQEVVFFCDGNTLIMELESGMIVTLKK